MFALADQLRRASVSISSNVAEGASRSSDIESTHFLEIALVSAFEVESQLQIAYRRGFITEKIFNNVICQTNTIEKRLNGFISKIENIKKIINHVEQ